MEAMAAGLPVVADNRGGAKDRIVQGTGWLCDNIEQHLSIIRDINGKLLDEMGRKAKEHARAAFNPDAWMEAICE
jgi:glycosyltransferase involved in cell wall biosynthesis